MDVGETEYPEACPNTDVDKREVSRLSVRTMVSPRGDTSGDAPTGVMRADCWKYGLGSDEAACRWEIPLRSGEPVIIGLPFVLDQELFEVLVVKASLFPSNLPPTAVPSWSCGLDCFDPNCDGY